MQHYVLGDVITEISERENNPSNSEYERFVGLEHYVSGEVEIENYGSTANLNSAMKVFNSGDILVARRNVYLKRASVVYFDGLTSGDSIVLRPKNETIGRILPFILNTDDFWDYADQYSDGTMSKRLSPKVLKQYEFDLPDDNLEQLADILWAMVDVKKSYQRLLKRTDELVKSQFIEMFGDTLTSQSSYGVVALSDVFEKPQGGEWGKDDPDNIGVPVLRTTNFTDEGIIDFTEVATRIIPLDKVEKKSLVKGDILIEKSGGSNDKPVGRVVYFESDDNTYLNNNFTAKLHLNGIFDFNPFYVFKFMFVNYWMGGTRIHEGKTTGIHNIRLNDYLEKTYIPLAPRDVQDEFVAFAEESDKSK